MKKTAPRTGLPRELEWVERTSRVMDNAFRLPGTRFRFGLDPIIGLFPLLGDLVTFSISSMLVFTMVKRGISSRAAVKMLVNVAVDYIIGQIPLLGDLFDFGFKANTRNLEIMREYYEEGKHQGSGKRMAIGVLVVLVLVMVLFFALAIWLASWLLSALSVSF